MGDDKRAQADVDTENDTLNERERAAGAREQNAEDREQSADVWESAADERERRLADGEQPLDQRDRSLGRSVASRRERARASTERARALLAASIERMNRSEAALRRADESAARQQHTIDRETSGSAAAWARSQGQAGSTPSALAWAAQRLQARLVATALELAEVADLAAARYERLVREDADSAEQHRRLADDARARAKSAREIAQCVSDRPDSGHDTPDRETKPWGP